MDFLSKNRYIALPPFQKPKVFLAVDTPSIAKNSLKLYRVYSKKALILKGLVSFLAKYKLINLFAKPADQSDFAAFLEKNSPFLKAYDDLILSKYMATDQDKIILQIQSGFQVKGYVKYALNDKGADKISREIEGTAKMKSLGIKTLTITEEGSYKDLPYFISEEVEEIQASDFSLPDFPFERLCQDASYKLAEHPRILSLRKYFEEKGQEQHLKLLDQLAASSTQAYRLAYEHGDFSPWNLFINKSEVWLFDLEFYEEEGIELFDKIAYHFRYATHLKGMDGNELATYIIDQLGIEASEGLILFKVFLLKELVEKDVFGREHLVDISELFKIEF